MQQGFISQNFTAVLVYSRPPLVFVGMISALAVLLKPSFFMYAIGLSCLCASMVLDLVDGWFAARFRPHAKLAHLADRIMDKLVYSFSFPVIALGMMWHYHQLPQSVPSRLEMLHIIFVLLLCVTVLVRDNFAHFMRNFALRRGEEEELKEITRLRTSIAAPVSAILYAYAFYHPSFVEYPWFNFIPQIPLKALFFIEIVFFVINFTSIARYCKRYGSSCLDDLCLGDELLRRKILAIFPNALTVMNAAMGMLAIFFASLGRAQEAVLILIGAAMFDKLDGALARKLGLTEPLPSAKPKKYYFTVGSVMDDISDALSFCIAPAVILYLLLEKVPDERVQALPYGWIALFYVIMGVTRLVYFLLDQEKIPGFFKGIPVPGAAILVSGPFIMLGESTLTDPEAAWFWTRFSLGLMVALGVLMNSYPIRYMHLGRFMGRHPWFGKLTVVLVLGFALTPWFGYITLLYMGSYALSPLITWKISPEIASQENKIKKETTDAV